MGKYGQIAPDRARSRYIAISGCIARKKSARVGLGLQHQLHARRGTSRACAGRTARDVVAAMSWL
eukprot:5298097-Prymnesium_polylepis.2